MTGLEATKMQLYKKLAQSAIIIMALIFPNLTYAEKKCAYSLDSLQEETVDIREAKKSLVDELENIDGFVGAGIGDRHIKLYVIINAPVIEYFEKQFGDSYQGWPVVIEQTGGFRLLTGS